MFDSSEMGLMACPKLKEGAHGFRERARFQREPNFELVPHPNAYSFISQVALHNELYA